MMAPPPETPDCHPSTFTNCHPSGLPLRSQAYRTRAPAEMCRLQLISLPQPTRLWRGATHTADSDTANAPHAFRPLPVGLRPNLLWRSTPHPDILIL